MGRGTSVALRGYTFTSVALHRCHQPPPHPPPVHPDTWRSVAVDQSGGPTWETRLVAGSSPAPGSASRADPGRGAGDAILPRRVTGDVSLPRGRARSYRHGALNTQAVNKRQAIHLFIKTIPAPPSSTPGPNIDSLPETNGYKGEGKQKRERFLPPRLRR